MPQKQRKGGGAEKPAPSFTDRIRAHIADMSPTERRLAEFLLDFPGELASYAANEIAGLAGVSNAAVTRFVRKIGYDSYDAARQHVRSERNTGSALYLVHAATGADDPLAAQLQQAQANLNMTFAALSGQEADAIANALLTARRVWCLGTRSGRTAAEYTAFQLSQVIPSVTLAPRAGETLGEHVASMTAEDVVILFGLRRPARRLGAVIEAVKATGAAVLFISDESFDRRPDLAWHLKCQTAAPGPLFNHTAVLAVCHLIATRAIELSGKKGRQRLASIEAAHDALDEM